MRRSFSKELEEDREFEIGGELFEFVYPHWKVGADLFDAERAKYRAALNGDKKEDSEEPEEFSFVVDTEMAIRETPTFLSPTNDAHKRWKALCARKVDPVPRHQIVQCYRWLVEVTSGFPTTQPEGSTSGAGSSEDSSTEGAS